MLPWSIRRMPVRPASGETIVVYPSCTRALSITA